MIRWIFTGCWLIVFISSFSQKPYTVQFTSNDGLPSSECYYTITDKKGYIWVATDYGISCYNGRRFRNYVKELPGTSNIFLLCDPQNRIWFSNMNGSVGYIENGEVKRIPCEKELEKRISEDMGLVSSLECDDHGNIWIGGISKMFLLKKKDHFRRFSIIEYNRRDRILIARQITESNWVRIWGDRKEPYKHTKKDFSICKVLLQGKHGDHFFKLNIKEGNGFPTYFQMRSLHSGKIVISFNDELVVFDPRTEKIQRYNYGKKLHAIYEDASGNLFVTCINGGGVLFFKDGNLNGKPAVLLDKNSVGSMSIDKEGGYWFTSVERGLFYIPHLDVKGYSQFKGLNESIVNIFHINDQLYVVNNRMQLMALNPVTGKSLFAQPPYIYLLAKAEIVPHGNKLLYVGQHVFDMTPDLNNFTLHSGSSFPVIDANGFTVTKKGENYALLFNSLAKLKDHQWEIVKRLPVRGMCVFYSHSLNELLIGTKKGIYCYRNGKVKKVFGDILGKQEVLVMNEASDGSLIAGTKNGGVFILKNGKWINLTQSSGLKSDFCKNICVRESGLVLLILQGGVDYFYTNSPTKIYRLGNIHGLHTSEVTSLTTYGKELFLGTTSGVISIPLKNLKKKQLKPRIYLRERLFNDKKTTARTFNYGNNTYRFFIDVLSYMRQDAGNKYLYRLKGMDHYPKYGSTDYIEYTNLPAGDYELLVSTKGENGKIAPYKSLVRFTVLTPFWQTWWFISLCFLAALSLIVGIIVWRIRIVNNREAKRNELLRQIAESQVVALRAQMNPHFIFNAINSIQDFVLQNETEEAYNYLSKFARLIRLVMHQSNDNFLTLEQEIDWLKIYMDLEKLRFKGKFEFELYVDPELEMEDRIPNMLIQPHLENAIWHGIMPLRGKRPGKVKLSFHKVDRIIQVEIEDNGVGRNSVRQKGHESSGIRLVNDRLERLSQLENIKFWQVINDLTDSEGNPTGTQIILFIDLLE